FVNDLHGLWDKLLSTLKGCICHLGEMIKMKNLNIFHLCYIIRHILRNRKIQDQKIALCVDQFFIDSWILCTGCNNQNICIPYFRLQIGIILYSKIKFPGNLFSLIFCSVYKRYMIIFGMFYQIFTGISPYFTSSEEKYIFICNVFNFS